nr:hypothetical protein BaRGS_010519 [Batillaria attramentaria]
MRVIVFLLIVAVATADVSRRELVKRELAKREFDAIVRELGLERHLRGVNFGDLLRYVEDNLTTITDVACNGVCLAGIAYLIVQSGGAAGPTVIEPLAVCAV